MKKGVFRFDDTKMGGGLAVNAPQICVNALRRCAYFLFARTWHGHHGRKRNQVGQPFVADFAQYDGGRQFFNRCFIAELLGGFFGVSGQDHVWRHVARLPVQVFLCLRRFW